MLAYSYLCPQKRNDEIQDQERDQAEAPHFRQIQGRGRASADHQFRPTHQGGLRAEPHQRGRDDRRRHTAFGSHQPPSAPGRPCPSARLGPDETRNRERQS